MHCICGAWDLGDVKDSGDRFKLLSQLVGIRKDLEGIIFEVAPGMKGHALEWHLRYRGVVELVAKQMDVPFIPVNAGTWKKHSLGHGQAGKLESKTLALKQYGLDPSAPHDASDALHILRHALDTVEVRAAS